MHKVLTVSIAAYNAENWLERCLESFIVLDILDLLEVIIVNDGSQDNTIKIAELYCNKYPGTFILIDKENGGHGSTINAAIKKAKGKYFKTVDADDWVSKDGLEKLCRNLMNLDVDLILNPHIDYYDDTKKEAIKNCINSKHIEYNKSYQFDEVLKYINLVMHDMTYRSELLKQCSYSLDEHCFYVDQEYTLFYLKLVKKIVFQDYPVYYYLHDRTGQSISVDSYIRRVDEHFKVLKTMINYYNLEKKDMSIELKQVILFKISIMFNMQYKIRMLFHDIYKSKKCVEELSKYLLSNDKEIVSSVRKNGKLSNTILLIRKFNYTGFKSLYRICSKNRYV